MKKSKWLARVAKMLVLSMLLSLTLCVTAHAENGWGHLYLYDENGLIVANDELVVSYLGTSHAYKSGMKVPSYTPVTVSCAAGLKNVSVAPHKTTVDGGLITDIDSDSFTFLWGALGLHYVDFTVQIGNGGSDIDDPANPDDPGDDPAGPVDPVNPDDPSDPDDPQDPDDPSDPDDPQNPDDPSDPDDPQNPDDPSDPDDPQNPDDPSDPDDPQNPDDPSNPDGPKDPTDPSNPGNGEDPNAPKPVTTADTMMMTLWATVLMISAAVAVTVIRRKKKA